MGEARRRKLAAAAAKPAAPEVDLLRWAEAARAEGGGVWHLTILSALTAESFFTALAAGDAVALAARMAADRALETVFSFRHASQNAPLCLLCPATLWREHMPACVTVLTAAVDGPKRAVANVVCGTCFDRLAVAGAGALQAALLDAHRRHLIPDLRVLPPLAAPGHA